MTKPEWSDLCERQISSTPSTVIYDLNTTSGSTYISGHDMNPQPL